MRRQALTSSLRKSYYQYTYSPYCFLDISWGTDKENLFYNQKLL